MPIPSLYVKLGLAAVVFAAGFGSAWWVQGVKLGHAQLELAEVKQAVEVATGEAERDKQSAERQVKRSDQALAKAKTDIRRLHRVYGKKLADVASTSRPAVGPDAGRLLRDATGGGAEAGRDPGAPTTAAAATAAVPGTGFVSEAQVVAWANGIIEQVKVANATHAELTAIVESLGCAKVVP